MPVPVPSLHTVQLHRWLERIRNGDLAARDDLLRIVGLRLERLARKMLRRFSRVHRWVETDDVLQNALLRLLRALQHVRPDSMRDFFALAAETMRRELLDLARHYYGPQGVGANHATPLPGRDSEDALECVAVDDDRRDLERWCAFHEEVAALPADEREVVDLHFYHGRTHTEVADQLQVNVRTVQRRWTTALYKLHHPTKHDHSKA